MRKIAVGILAGRGFGPEPRQVYARVVRDPFVSTVFVLLGEKHPTDVLPTGPNVAWEVFPAALAGHRGLARQRLLSKLSSGNSYDIIALLDDDTEPLPGYFEGLNSLEETDEPTLYTGKLLNRDGERCWDICSFNSNGDPIVVPYNDWQNPKYSAGLYASGPQHIFNRAGYRLGALVQYPDLGYGEDTNFCINFKRMGGKISLIPEIVAQLTHQHNPPNLWV